MAEKILKEQEYNVNILKNTRQNYFYNKRKQHFKAACSIWHAMFWGSSNDSAI